MDDHCGAAAAFFIVDIKLRHDPAALATVLAGCTGSPMTWRV